MSQTVKVSTGLLRGTDDEGTHAFKGIPYAAPPAGELRHRPPAPPASWTGTRDASSFGPIALQQALPGVLGELGAPQQPSGDDCLSLNVWTPDPGAVGLPVLVWIHGGAFYSGSGAEDVFNGASFARNGVVCVTINYRLGAQGFWHLAAQFPELGSSGNLGMLDQVMALQWVRENIDAFGGDPSKVTIAGESAGAMSVMTLMAMPSARGLFQRAICQSASIVGISAPTAEKISGLMLDKIGVSPGDYEALMRTSPAALLEAQTALGNEMNQTRDPARFGEAASTAMLLQPTYGTPDLPQRPDLAIASGSAPEVDLLIGSTRDEALIFLAEYKEMFTEDVVAATVVGLFGAAGEDGLAALDRYRHNRPGAPFHRLAAAIETDRIFGSAKQRFAEAQGAHNKGVWMYRFDWAAKEEWGAHHYLDVPFTFNTINIPYTQWCVGTCPPQRLADDMHGAWTAFVRNGDPGHEDLPVWPQYDEATRSTMIFDEPCRVEDDPGGDELSLWKGVL